MCVYVCTCVRVLQVASLLLCADVHSHAHLCPCVCRYCRDCSKLVLASEWEEHRSHDMVAMVTKEMLDHPTQLLLPLEDRKAQAVGLCGWRGMPLLKRTGWAGGPHYTRCHLRYTDSIYVLCNEDHCSLMWVPWLLINVSSNTFMMRKQQVSSQQKSNDWVLLT